MPEPSPAHGRSFDENIDILFDELVLATKWGRPSLLLAVHKSRIGQDKAEKALESRLKKAGQSVVRIWVNDERSDVPHLMLSSAADSSPVFFVSNIDWGGGEDGKEAYRALNLQRELLVEHQIRAVFWLTPTEAMHLPRYAPDFWAFRHRVIEFVGQRATTRATLPAGVLVWDVQKSVDPFDSLQEGIRARRELLGRLPRNLEALSTRIELNYSLGYLHWLAGEWDNARQAFRDGIELAAEHELPELKSRLLNGMGILQFESQNYSAALDTFKEGLQNWPSSSSLLTNLSAVSCMLGRNQEAMNWGKKAIRSSPANAEIWNRLGYVYAAMAKPDEAISCFTKAAEFAPRMPSHHEALAVLYGAIDRLDEARRQLETARDLLRDSDPSYLDVLEESIMGHAERAQQLLGAAVANGRITRLAMRRDPNLAILLEEAQIEALSA